MATDSKSTWPAGMSLLAPKKRLGDAGLRVFQVFAMFWTEVTMDAAFGVAGSMQTETLSVPPEPV
jgi:hypothetical protein